MPASAPEISTQQRQKILVMWILWGAFLTGICVCYFLLHPKAAPVPEGSPAVPWPIFLGPLAISAFIRWSLLPRAPDERRALMLMIVGIALAESLTFFGLFLFPQHHLEFFAASFMGIFQFIPTYARRVYLPEEETKLRQP